MTYQRKTNKKYTYYNTKNRKIPLADYSLIASLRKAGYSLNCIARRWKVDHTTIMYILRKMKIAPPLILLKEEKPKPKPKPKPKYPEPPLNKKRHLPYDELLKKEIKKRPKLYKEFKRFVKK